MTLTFVSISYAALIIILFYGVRLHSRKDVLVFASFGYVFLINRNACMALVVSSVVSYLAGMGIGVLIRSKRYRTGRVLAGLCITICIGILLFFKYSLVSGILIPIGFSYYIFQIIGYFADICRGEINAETNPLNLFLYLAWFPKFVSGPIERKEHFDRSLQQITEVRFLDPDRWINVAHYFITGLFYKMVLADRIGMYVDSIFTDMHKLSGSWMFIGMIMYTLQIYFDFAGYSYAVVGVSRAFGIDLTENFRMPYLSANISEFWRRWHISLSTWLKDNVYIPLGGNRKGTVRKVINSFVVFAICGIWHGSELSFLIWGLLHGSYMAVDTFLASRYMKLRKGMIGRVLTFFAVAFAWVFFRAETLSQAMGFFRIMFTAEGWFRRLEEGRLLLCFPKIDIAILSLSIIAFLLLEIRAYLRNMSIPEVIIDRPFFIRHIYALLVVTAIIAFGVYGTESINHMIYMQF